MPTASDSDRATALKAAGRRAGALYLLLIAGAFNTLYVPRAFVVRVDAAETARRILAGELTYRFGVLSDLVSAVAFLWLVVALYDLLAHADRWHARLMVVLVAVGATIGIVNLLNQLAPLVLLRDPAALATGLTPPQREALALGFLRLRSQGGYLAMIFWGLWLYPFGVLVLKSRYFPRPLGWLLYVGCAAYVTLGVVSLVLPGYRAVMSSIALPFYAVGELSMIVWLLVKGATLPPDTAAPAPAR